MSEQSFEEVFIKQIEDTKWAPPQPLPIHDLNIPVLEEYLASIDVFEVERMCVQSGRRTDDMYM